MRFFVPRPFATTKQLACEAYECMRNFAKKSLGLNTTDRRIYQIEFVRDGEQYDACVGQPEYDFGETVVAILEAPRKYLVCTPNHGGYRGKPICIGKRCVKTTIAFEG